MPDTTQDVHFPKAGIDRAGAYGRQPVRQWKDGTYVRTAAQGVNVRGYEPSGGRDRGGSRYGTSKYVSARASGAAWVIQDVAVVSTAKGGSVPQQSPSGRVNYVLAVSQGQVRWTTPPGGSAWSSPVNNTGDEPPLAYSGPVRSTSINQRQYFVDGTNYCLFAPVTNSVERWTPAKGLLPRDDQRNGARLIATWRGRAVLSGVLRDPQNWFMSRVGDPLDFAYSPSPTTATDPVAGNNSPLGLIGDVITALIPYTDDVLIFGGNSTIYAMRGDPASGGQVDLISDITGMAFGKAWCKDPYGNVYFFGSKPGIWRMAGTSPPQRISAPVEPLLAGLDTGNLTISMAWDDREQSVRVFLTPSDQPAATTHLCWEYRSNAWWTDTFADNNHNPTCAAAIDGNSPSDRTVVVGGWDGYVRYLDPAASTDDGQPINSTVLLGPILTQELDEMLLKEVQGVLATGSGSVTWDVLAAPTAEAAIASTPRASGTFSAGRTGTQPVRVADHAIYLRLSSTARWAMESIRAVFAGRGKVRRRKP